MFMSIVELLTIPFYIVCYSLGLFVKACFFSGFDSFVIIYMVL